jgi:hypothetical protein
VANASNERGPTILAHASEAVGHGVRDAKVFFCFLVVGWFRRCRFFSTSCCPPTAWC